MLKPWLETFYNDFFDPPELSSTLKRDTAPSSRKTKVRFHEEVKVREIKARGKGIPVSTLTLIGSGDDDDDDDDDEEDEDEDEDEDMDASDTGESIAEDIYDSEVGAVDGYPKEEIAQDNLTMDRFENDLFAEDHQILDGEIMRYHRIE